MEERIGSRWGIAVMRSSTRSICWGDAQKRGIGALALFAGDGECALYWERNFKSMAVWVLEQNRSRSFYEKAGAHMAMSKVIEIGGTKLMDVAYAWSDLNTLAKLS